LASIPGYEASKPVRVGNVACERFGLDIFGEVVGMMALGADVLCRIAGRLAGQYAADRRSHAAAFSRSFSHRSLIFVARGVRAAGTGAKQAAR
jgi:hypothetical protein